MLRKHKSGHNMLCWSDCSAVSRDVVEGKPTQPAIYKSLRHQLALLHHRVQNKQTQDDCFHLCSASLHYGKAASCTLIIMNILKGNSITYQGHTAIKNNFSSFLLHTAQIPPPPPSQAHDVNHFM